MKQNLWQTLEALPGLSAVPWVWQVRLGEQSEPIRHTLLQSKDYAAELYPCPKRCGCAHRVRRQADGTYVARCDCVPRRCGDIHLTLAEVTPMYLDPAVLGRVLCKCFGLNPRPASSWIPDTWQIGSWSVSSVAAMLTIQSERAGFHRAIAELVATHRQPFILFSPTAELLDDGCMQMLDSVGAGFFSLECHTTLTPEGLLVPNQTPGELFRRFTPEPGEEPNGKAAREVMAIIGKLDTGPAPTPLLVFRLYCIELKSIRGIAEETGTSVGTIHRRLDALEAATGKAPQQLRAYSPYFAQIEEQLLEDPARGLRSEDLLEENEG